MDRLTQLTGAEATKILNGLRILQRYAYENAVEKGFHPATSEQHIEKMGEEIHEFIIALSGNNAESKKIPGHSCVAEEAADIMILLANWMHSLGIGLGPAILAKLAYNKTRPFKHEKES